MPADFQKPNPNDAKTRRARNNRIAARLQGSDDDVVEIFLETNSNGSTTWVIIFRDGTIERLAN